MYVRSLAVVVALPDGIRVRNTNGVFGVLLVGFSGRPAVTEGDGEGVECGFPAHRPSGLAAAGGVQGSGDEVEASQGGLGSLGDRNTCSMWGVARCL